ncbi:hypothetical protein SGFS_061640 [Streptomyces graminofaciens]|uniref:Lipoprotein n=1 Tax=Streptomyces graminofaciens TaxID=68212 RepID=A0ABN5VN45_9ACTN|nr:hypothetical protein [Streptomyces graminofaciens]BBC34870.1 hypothetical protein SGFS_061640 [Streptomyces graminofaciens]
MVRKLSRGAAALVVGLVALPLVAGCSGGDGDDDKASGKSGGDESSPVAAVVAPAKVEVLAQLTGCKVKIRTEAEELREGVCHTTAGDYLITTFPKEELKDTWLDAASIYGGKYLVGPQWVITAPPKALKGMKAKVGGTVHDLSKVSGS